MAERWPEKCPKRSRPKARPPTGDCPFLYTSRPPQREEVGSHLDTNRGKQKRPHPLPPRPPCLAAARAHSLQLAACSGAQNPGVPAPWEHRSKLGRVETGCQGPPCSASHPEQDQPPRASPRPLEEHRFCCWEHVVSWAPKAGVLRHALPWPRPRPSPMGAMKKESKEQSKAAGDPQSCKMAQEDLPPCTVHPCSTSPSFRLQRGLAWDPDRYRANPSSVVQWPHL